jgi:hypothetical protein
MSAKRRWGTCRPTLLAISTTRSPFNGSRGDRAQNLEVMTERSDTEVFQVLVSQIAEDRESISLSAKR